MKKIVISLLLLAVCDIPLRASDTNAAEQPSIKISQGLLDKAQQTLGNSLVKEEEKIKVENALKNYNANPTTKTYKALNHAIHRAQPGARKAKREYDKARNTKPEVREALCEYLKAWRAKPGVREARRTYRTQPKVREAHRTYECAWRARRKEKLAKKLSLQQQQTLRDIQRNRSSAAAPETVEAPLAQWLENTSPEELESLLQDAQQQQTIARQAHNNQNDLFAGFDFDAVLHNLEEAPDLGAFDEFDNDSAMQSSSEGNFFGAEDLRERYSHLLVPQPQATVAAPVRAARVQARRRSSDARAQQLTQRRLLPSSDTSDVEEFDDSTVSTDPRQAVALSREETLQEALDKDEVNFFEKAFQEDQDENDFIQKVFKPRN